MNLYHWEEGEGVTEGRTNKAFSTPPYIEEEAYMVYM